jgi:hypothetical protein
LQIDEAEVEVRATEKVEEVVVTTQASNEDSKSGSNLFNKIIGLKISEKCVGEQVYKEIVGELFRNIFLGVYKKIFVLFWPLRKLKDLTFINRPNKPHTAFFYSALDKLAIFVFVEITYCFSNF